MEYTPPKVPKKMSPVLWIVLVAIVILAATGFIYYRQTTDTNSNTNSANTNTVVVSNLNISVDTSNWRIHTNDDLGLALKHPLTWDARLITSDTLNYEIGDSILSHGSCDDGGCAVSTDVCEIVISDEPDSADSSIQNMISWINNQPFYKGDSISQRDLNGHDAIRTAVSVTPIENGVQGMGSYYLISTANSNTYLSATLVKGYKNEACGTDMSAIMTTLTQ